jgi:hypothetical protein
MLSSQFGKEVEVVKKYGPSQTLETNLHRERQPSGNRGRVDILCPILFMKEESL